MERFLYNNAAFMKTILSLWLMLVCAPLGAQTHKVLLLPCSNSPKSLADGLWKDSRTILGVSRIFELIDRGMEDSVPYISSSGCRAPEGQAFNFLTCHYWTDMFRQDSIRLRQSDYSFVSLDVLQCWDMDSVATAYARKNGKIRKRDFSKVLRSLTGGKLQEEEAKPRGRPGFARYSGLVPYSYAGENCFLLWDDRWKMRVFREHGNFAFGGNGGDLYSLPYDFQDVKQLVLCRYSPNCYVLLLLTRPMIEMD